MNNLVTIMLGLALIALVLSSGCVAPEDVGAGERTANITAPPAGAPEGEPPSVYAPGKYTVGDTISKNGFDVILWDVDPEFGTGLPGEINKVFGITVNVDRTGPSSIPENIGDCDGIPVVGLWDPVGNKMYTDLNPYPKCNNKTDFWRKTVFIDRRVYSFDRTVQVVVSMLDDITDQTTMGMIDPNSPTKYVFDIVPFEQ